MIMIIINNNNNNNNYYYYCKPTFDDADAFNENAKKKKY